MARQRQQPARGFVNADPGNSDCARRGPDPIETTRANLTLYVTVTSFVGIVMLWHQGIFDARAGWTSLWLAPAYYVGLVGGIGLFPRFSDTRFRQFTLLLLIAVSTGILLA